MLLEDLSVLEQMTHDLEILLEEAPRLYFFAQELEKLIEAEIKKKRKLLMEIVDAHVH